MDKVKIQAPRLDATLSAVDKESRRVDVKWYTGAAVDRLSWEGRYSLKLSLDPAHVRMGRFESGTAPVLDSHSDWSLRDVIGVVEKANLDGSATIRLADTPSVEETWQKIQQGIIRNGSVGARIFKLKDVTPEDSKQKSYLAIDWEPQEFSLVPIGADPNAGIRAAESTGEVEVEVEFAERATSPMETTMENKDKTIEAGDQAREVNTDEVRAAAAAAERQRVIEIGKLGQKAKLDAAFMSEHIEKGTSVEKFRELAFDKLATRSEENPTRSHAEVTRDERDTLRANADAVIMNLFDRKNKVDGQNQFRGMGVLRLAEEVLNRTGVSTRGRSKAEIAELSMHATADFPLILADSARKQMLAMYELANPTYKVWAKASTSPDFKTMSRLRLGETPTLLTVAEGAQITLATMTESREQYALATYGRGVSFTRQMLINDDLGAFNDLIRQFGMQASRLENKTVYAILTANAAMSDTVALFHASHSNLGSGAIGNTGLDAMFTAMATQKGLDGVSILNLVPKFLIVPSAKSMTAAQNLAEISNAVKASDRNWFAGRLTPVADAELDASSTAVWYGAADPMIAPGVEYCHLEGAEGPQMIRKENEQAVLGIQLYCFLDFAAKAVDWRPLYKSTGV